MQVLNSLLMWWYLLYYEFVCMKLWCLSGQSEIQKFFLCSLIRCWQRWIELVVIMLLLIRLCWISSGLCRLVVYLIGELVLYVFGLSCGLLRMFEVYLWLQVIQFDGGCSVVFVVNLFGVCSSVILVMNLLQLLLQMFMCFGLMLCCFISQVLLLRMFFSLGWFMC